MAISQKLEGYQNKSWGRFTYPEDLVANIFFCRYLSMSFNNMTNVIPNCSRKMIYVLKFWKTEQNLNNNMQDKK